MYGRDGTRVVVGENPDFLSPPPPLSSQSSSSAELQMQQLPSSSIALELGVLLRFCRWVLAQKNPGPVFYVCVQIKPETCSLKIKLI